MLGYITDPSVDGGLVRRDLPEPRPGEHGQRPLPRRAGRRARRCLARQAAGKVVLTR